jgi:hypothetical protein
MTTGATRIRSTRRALLGLAMISGGAVAARAALPRQAEAAPGDPLVLGSNNDSGTSQTALTARQDGSATLVVTNTSTFGTGIRGNGGQGYGVWGSGDQAGVRGFGSAVGLLGEANSTGIAVLGRRGTRSGNLPTNTGVLGFAAYGTGVIGEGGGATGVRGFAWQHNGTSAPIGVGVQGVGTVGVLAQSSGSGIGLKAVGGRAIEASGAVVIDGPTTVNGNTIVNGTTTLNGVAGIGGVLNVNSHINSAGTITGYGGKIGVVARAGPGGIALKAIGPAGGTAIQAGGDVHVLGDLTVGGAIQGKGTGLTAVPASSLTGVVAPDRIPLAFARRDRGNSFGKVTEFRDTARFNARIAAAGAGRATLEAGKTFVDVDLPEGILSSASVVIATPQESLHGTGFYAKPTGTNRIRISMESAPAEDIVFGYAVLN